MKDIDTPSATMHYGQKCWWKRIPGFLETGTSAKTALSMDWMFRQSRPAERLTGLEPGELFVHRNVVTWSFTPT